MARATVDRIIARVTQWSGVQVLVQEDNGDSDTHDQSAFGRAPDKLHVSVRLTALTADGASVTSDRDDFGITLPRHVPRRQRSRSTVRATEKLTRDIEEAIKLGDQVAVLRVGGRLAQLADPAYLLAHPVDDFVADFVGRDRGYRALSFQASPQFPLTRERTVRLGATPAQATASARDGWVLVIDADRRPLGWIEPSRITVPIQPGMLHRGGTVAKEGGPLRNTLDAALSSPSRRGVIVDNEGAILGTVRAHEVLAEIEERSRPALQPDSPQEAGVQPEGGVRPESLQPVEEAPA